MSARVASPLDSLHGLRLLAARVAWVAVAVTALAIVVFSVPSSYEYYSDVCDAASGVCSERAVGQATPEGVRALQDVGLSVRSYAISNVVIDKVFQLAWFAVGALIFWWRPDDRMALLTSLFLVTFGTVTVDPTAANALISSEPTWWLPVRSLQVLGSVCVVLFFLLFPGGLFVPRWTRWLAVAFIAYLSIDTLFPNLYSYSPFLEMGSQWVFMGYVVSLVWSQVHRYRRVSTPAQRLQTRWVVFGTTLAIAGTFPFRVPLDFTLVDGDTPFVLLVLEAGFTLSFLLVPISIGVAMVRSRLFDVDVLINRTLVYGSLSATLVALYFGLVVVLQRLLILLIGQRSTLAVVASTLLIAALFNPFRRRIQSLIDRRFYRKKYDARRTLEAFSATLRDETNLDALSDDLVGVVRKTMQPSHASLWLRPRAGTGLGTKERAG